MIGGNVHLGVAAGTPESSLDLCFNWRNLQMLTILLIVLVIFMLGGWGYGRGRGAGYGNPMGIVGLLLLIILVVFLVRGGL